MLRFTVVKNKVILDPQVLLVQEFKDILNYSHTETKSLDLGNQFLLYVYYCCDLTPENLLRDVDYRIKEKQANTRAFNISTPRTFNDEEKKLLDAAIDAYNFFNETALERAGLAYDRKIDEFRSKLEELRPEVHTIYKECVCNNCVNEFSVVEKYVSNEGIIGNYAKQLNDLAVFKLKAMETAKKIENTGRVRGSKGSSMIERGVFVKQALEETPEVNRDSKDEED